MGAMPEYRLYCLDGAGRFTNAHEISAADDEGAIDQAKEMKLAVKCELWERGRKVATLPPHGRRGG